MSVSLALPNILSKSSNKPFTGYPSLSSYSSTRVSDSITQPITPEKPFSQKDILDDLDDKLHQFRRDHGYCRRVYTKIEEYKELSLRYHCQVAIVLNTYPEIEPEDIDPDNECEERESQWSLPHDTLFPNKQSAQKKYNAILKYFSKLDAKTESERARIESLKTKIHEKLQELNKTSKVPSGFVETFNAIQEKYKGFDETLDLILEDKHVKLLDGLESVEVGIDDYEKDEQVIMNEMKKEDDERSAPLKIISTKIPKSILKSTTPQIKISKRKKDESEQAPATKKQKITHHRLPSPESPPSDFTPNKTNLTSARERKEQEINEEPQQEQSKKPRKTTPLNTATPPPSERHVHWGENTTQIYELESSQHNIHGIIYFPMAITRISSNKTYGDLWKLSLTFMNELNSAAAELIGLNTQLDDVIGKEHENVAGSQFDEIQEYMDYLEFYDDGKVEEDGEDEFDAEFDAMIELSWSSWVSA